MASQCSIFLKLLLCETDITGTDKFNNCAILDEYEMGEVIGEGGFGKVVLAKQVGSKKKVAIKFMDISEQRKCFIILIEY